MSAVPAMAAGVAAAAAVAIGPMLRVQGLRKQRGDRTVLDGLSFEVGPGQAYALLGPNGCGKSTALEIVAGLLPRDGGHVEVAAAPDRASLARRVGLCPQRPALYRDLRPAENLDFHARVHGLPTARRAERVARLMHLFGLHEQAHLPVGRLSGGWQQRVSLAVALVHAPALLLLDEPTAAVDVAARHALWQVLQALRGEGTTLLFTTHDLAEAQRLCTHAGILRGGRLVAEGTVAALLQRVPGRLVAQLQPADERQADARAAALGWPVRRHGGQWSCLVPQPLSLAELVLAFEGVAITGASVQPVTLEHAYLELVPPA